MSGGQGLTSGIGSIASVTLRPTDITTQLITVGQGTLTAAGNNVTVHISGNEFTSVQGTLVVGPTLLAGSGATSAAGSLTPSSSVALSGSASTLATGNVAASQEADDLFIASGIGNQGLSFSVALSGTSISGSQGTLITSDAQQALSGSSVSCAQTSPVPTFPRAITGQVITGQQYFVGVPVTEALTGTEVSVTAGYMENTDNARSTSISGQAITLEQGHLVTTRHQQGGDDGGVTLVRDRRKDEKTILEFIKNFVRNL